MATGKRRAGRARRRWGPALVAGRAGERGWAGERGQAAAELVAVVPIALAVCLALAQLAIAGFALWTAGNAARAGARAAQVGGDPKLAARSALPEPLAEDARISAAGPGAGPGGGGAAISVRVTAPALIPGLPAIPVRARAALDPGGDDG